MSLDYDLTRVDKTNWETELNPSFDVMKLEGPDNRRRIYTEKQNMKTTCIIYGCLPVGIGEITESNWHEWWMRYSVFQSLVTRPGDEFSISARDVYDHVGLKTNVFPKVPTSRWYKNMLETYAVPLKSSIERDAIKDETRA